MQRHPADRCGLQPRTGHWAGQKHQVARCAQQILQQLCGQAYRDVQRHSGHVVLDLGHETRQAGGRRDLAGADAHDAARARQIVRRQRPFQRRPKRFGIAHQLPPAHRQQHPPPLAPEQGIADLRLQFAYAGRDGGLGGVQSLRRRCKGAEARDPEQGFKVIEGDAVQFMPPASKGRGPSAIPLMGWRHGVDVGRRGDFNFHPQYRDC